MNNSMNTTALTTKRKGVILIPRTGNAAMLLLEFVRDYTATSIVMLEADNVVEQNDYFKVKLVPVKHAPTAECVKYINDNL